MTRSCRFDLLSIRPCCVNITNRKGKGDWSKRKKRDNADRKIQLVMTDGQRGGGGPGVKHALLRSYVIYKNQSSHFWWELVRNQIKNHIIVKSSICLPGDSIHSHPSQREATLKPTKLIVTLDTKLHSVNQKSVSCWINKARKGGRRRNIDKK